ncbi:hypothetical protein Trydic_g6786 [Trypoxylus dichotomus]
MLATAKLEFQHMVELGIYRPSKSQWSGPLHMVPKRDGSWRPCGDFRALNAITKPGRYPVPNLQDFNAELSDPSSVRGYRENSYNRKVAWSDDTIHAFERLRESLSEAILLAHLMSPSVRQLIKFERTMEPPTFFSKKLTDAQKNYSAYDRELLATYLAVKYFRFLLERREFCIYFTPPTLQPSGNEPQEDYCLSPGNKWKDRKMASCNEICTHRPINRKVG